MRKLLLERKNYEVWWTEWESKHVLTWEVKKVILFTTFENKKESTCVDDFINFFKIYGSSHNRFTNNYNIC